MSKQNIWNIGSRGEIVFKDSSRMINSHYGADSVWEHPVAALVVMLLCGTLDFVMFKSLFASFLYDSVLLQCFGIVGMLVAFDVAPIYLGIMYKKHQQGYVVNKLMMGLALFTFLMALVMNFALRIAVKDLVLPDVEATIVSTVGEQAEAESTGNPLALTYALFAGTLPLVTSLVSFVISYIASNPLKDRIKRLLREQEALEDELRNYEAIITVYGDSEEAYRAKLRHYDDECYAAMKRSIREQLIFYCDYVREQIAERMGSPTATNIMSQSSRERINQILAKIDSYEDNIRRLKPEDDLRYDRVA